MRSITLAAVLVVVVSACGGGDDGAPADTGPRTVVASDFAFDRDVIEVQAGTEVVIELRNVGSVEHTWTVLKAGVTVTTGEDVMPDQVIAVTSADASSAATVTFIAPAAGDYQILCTIDGHLEAGMEATLRSTG